MPVLAICAVFMYGIAYHVDSKLSRVQVTCLGRDKCWILPLESALDCSALGIWLLFLVHYRILHFDDFGKISA